MDHIIMNRKTLGVPNGVVQGLLYLHLKCRVAHV